MAIAFRGAAVLLAGMVGGCATVPSEIAVPIATLDPNLPANQNVADGRYKLGPEANASTLAASAGELLPMEVSYSGVLAQIRAHEVVWRVESRNLSAYVNKLGNTSFAGAVIGGIGVLGKSLDVGRVGAAIGGGAGLWGNHYAYATQAENYRLATGAMNCMYIAVIQIPPDFWSATYDANGNMKLPREAYLKPGMSDKEKTEVNDGYDKLSTMFKRIYVAVNSVRDKLWEKQRKVVLATPSATEIAAGLKTQDEAAKKGEEAGKSMQKGVGETGRDVGANRLSEFQLQTMGRTQEKNSARLIALVKKQVDDAAALRPEVLGMAYKLPEQLDTCSKSVGS